MEETDLDFSYTVNYTKRKTLNIAVLPDLSIIVTAPLGTALDLINEKIKKRKQWIYKQLEFFKKDRSIFTAKNFIAGESHLYLGKHYRLKLHQIEDSSKLIKAGTYLHVYSDDLTREKIESIVKNWYRKKAEKYFNESIMKIFKKFKRYYINSILEHNSRADLNHIKTLKIPAIKLRSMKTRWASLSKEFTLNINPELIKAPIPCIEYVISHELCHLVHHNHSKEFYALLERLLPNFAELKEKLENFEI